MPTYLDQALPSDLDASLRDWAANLRQLVEECHVRAELAAQNPSRGTLADADGQLFANTHHVGVGNDPRWAARDGLWMAGRHVLSFAALVERPETAPSHLLLHRAQLECYGNIAWLLDRSATAEQRVARRLLSQIAEAHNLRLTYDKLGDPSASKTYRERRKVLIAHAEQIFNDVQIDLQQMHLSTIIGESQPGLAESVRRFLKSSSVDSTDRNPAGLYDFASVFSHPNSIPIAVFRTTGSPVNDRVPWGGGVSGPPVGGSSA